MSKYDAILLQILAWVILWNLMPIVEYLIIVLIAPLLAFVIDRIYSSFGEEA